MTHRDICHLLPHIPVMTNKNLTREKILEATETMLRRFGPDKVNVVDVASHLGVTHGSIYRHFPSKAALRSAVAEQWLKRVLPVLQEIADDKTLKADEKLYRWLKALAASKRERAVNDPGLFATYMQLVNEAEDVVLAYLDMSISQVETILIQGVREGTFDIPDTSEAAQAIFIATSRFHHPAHAAEWTLPDIDRRFDSVWAILLSGIRTRTTLILNHRKGEISCKEQQ